MLVVHSFSDEHILMCAPPNLSNQVYNIQSVYQTMNRNMLYASHFHPSTNDTHYRNPVKIMILLKTHVEIKKTRVDTENQNVDSSCFS